MLLCFYVHSANSCIVVSLIEAGPGMYSYNLWLGVYTGPYETVLPIIITRELTVQNGIIRVNQFSVEMYILIVGFNCIIILVYSHFDLLKIPAFDRTCPFSVSLYYTIVNDHFPPGENNTVFSKMLPLSYIIAAAVVAIVVLTAVITVVSVCCLSRKKRQGNKWGIVMSVVLMRVFLPRYLRHLHFLVNYY